MNYRLSHGFHRIGIVLAALALLLAAILAAEAEFSAAGQIVIVAAFLYFAARAIGWVLAGFIGSNRA